MSSRPARWWCVRSSALQLSWICRTRASAVKKAGPTSWPCSAATCGAGARAAGQSAATRPAGSSLARPPQGPPAGRRPPQPDHQQRRQARPSPSPSPAPPSRFPPAPPQRTSAAPSSAPTAPQRTCSGASWYCSRNSLTMAPRCSTTASSLLSLSVSASSGPLAARLATSVALMRVQLPDRPSRLACTLSRACGAARAGAALGPGAAGARRGGAAAGRAARRGAALRRGGGLGARPPRRGAARGRSGAAAAQAVEHAAG